MPCCAAPERAPKDQDAQGEGSPSSELWFGWPQCCASGYIESQPDLPAITTDEFKEDSCLETAMEQESNPAPNAFITVERSPNERLGLELDLLDGRTLQVCEVRSGAIKDYNRNAPLDHRLRVGDFVVGVDGVVGDAQRMLSTLQNHLVAKLEICRPIPFEVFLQRRSAKQGAGIVVKSAESSRSVSLLIAQVNPGLVSEWNKDHPEAAVEQLDRIVKVNDVERSTDVMLERIKQDLYLALQVVRPCTATVSDPRAGSP